MADRRGWAPGGCLYGACGGRYLVGRDRAAFGWRKASALFSCSPLVSSRPALPGQPAPHSSVYMLALPCAGLVIVALEVAAHHL